MDGSRWQPLKLAEEQCDRRKRRTICSEIDLLAQ